MPIASPQRPTKSPGSKPLATSRTGPLNVATIASQKRPVARGEEADEDEEPDRVDDGGDGMAADDGEAVVHERREREDEREEEELRPGEEGEAEPRDGEGVRRPRRLRDRALAGEERPEER